MGRRGERFDGRIGCRLNALHGAGRHELDCVEAMSGEVVAIMAFDGVLELGPCQGFTDVVFVICMNVNLRGPRWVLIARRAGAVGQCMWCSSRPMCFIARATSTTSQRISRAKAPVTKCFTSAASAKIFDALSDQIARNFAQQVLDKRAARQTAQFEEVLCGLAHDRLLDLESDRP